MNEILVTGATGRQGGAVARHLSKRGWRVRALCRDPESAAARALAGAGAKVVKGDLDDRSSLDAAVEGAYGVFSVQSYWGGAPGTKLGAEGEARQGRNLLDAAKAARVAHVVQSSGGGVTFAPELGPNRGKLAVEEHGRALRLPLTIVRAVYFMDNLDDPAMGLREPILEGRLDMPWDPDTRLQMIALEDLAYLVAEAFERPREFIGASFDAAGDELTMAQMAESLTRVTGRPVRFTGSSANLTRLREIDRDLADLFAAVHRHGFRAFLPGLRALHPGMLTFEGYLRWAGWGAVG